MKSITIAAALLFIQSFCFSQDTTRTAIHCGAFIPPDPFAPNYDFVSVGFGLGLREN
ncbi:MAG: hypothetical protein ABI763_10190 [Bacteroidota bacterium]